MSLDVSIIGGGPAGMAAAIAAARGGAKVRLWEKNHSLGRKLLATGNGRCNFSNASIDLKNYHSLNPANLSAFVSQVDGLRTIEEFRNLGIDPWRDERCRYFPRSQEASSVLSALKHEMERLGVEIKTRCEIVGLEADGNGFVLKQRGESHRCHRVIIACGGCASPQFGSNGSGYELARQMGHRVTELRPALVPWEMEGHWFHTLQGIRWDMELTVLLKDGRKIVFLDEGLFTKYGLSGPLALRSSRLVGEGIKGAWLNFMPGMSSEGLREMLMTRKMALEYRKAGDFLTGLLPERMGRMLIRELHVNIDSPVEAVATEKLIALAERISSWPIQIKRLRPFKDAQVTAGGVDLSQVFSETLESKLRPGLFFCGEVLDIDGDSGGYNLEWCWSSGRIAGLAAAGGMN